MRVDDIDVGGAVADPVPIDDAGRRVLLHQAPSSPGPVRTAIDGIGRIAPDAWPAAPTRANQDASPIPHRRAQPRPASVPAAGRYSQPTHPVYPSASMRASSHS